MYTEVWVDVVDTLLPLVDQRVAKDGDEGSETGFECVEDGKVTLTPATVEGEEDASVVIKDAVHLFFDFELVFSEFKVGRGGGEEGVLLFFDGYTAVFGVAFGEKDASAVDGKALDLVSRGVAGNGAFFDDSFTLFGVERGEEERDAHCVRVGGVISVYIMCTLCFIA